MQIQLQYNYYASLYVARFKVTTDTRSIFLGHNNISVCVLKQSSFDIGYADHLLDSIEHNFIVCLPYGYVICNTILLNDHCF